MCSPSVLSRRHSSLSARSLMAAPLVVFDEVIGAATFLHDSDDEFFNEDLAAKATILAGQLGSLLEATRLGEASREEHRRAEILAEVAHALHGTPDVYGRYRGLGRPSSSAAAHPAGLSSAAPRGPV